MEYGHSVFDVLGVTLTSAELNAAEGGLPDDGGDGVFKHFADKQVSTEAYPLAYFQVAQAVAERTDVLDLAGQLQSCVEATSECGRALTSSLGGRLFRRPLDEMELATFLAVFDEALAQGEAFEAAFRWTLQALLQAPQFLFRLEQETTGTVGQDRELTGYELAQRLASFLWLSVPDAALLAEAEAGTLNTAQGITGQVRRMLADPKARRFTEAFMIDFSRARLAAFEGVTDDLRESLNASIVASFQYHLWEANRSVADLFTTREFMVDAAVAELMGVAHSGGGLELVDVSQLPERVGLLSHPAMVAGMGDLEVGSFVNRGKYLMERLLCRNPIAVPAGLTDELDSFARDTAGLNEHERAALRMMRPECWGCHSQFEPLAFGFSRFDGAGRYVGEQDAAGKPLSLSGWVPTTTEPDSPRYESIAEYMQILATDPLIQDCMTEHFLNFATAHGTDPLVKQAAPVVGAAYRAQGSTLSGMVEAVAQSALFRSLQTVAPTAGTGN